VYIPHGSSTQQAASVVPRLGDRGFAPCNSPPAYSGSSVGSMDLATPSPAHLARVQ
jgi:hypothetical protein